MTRERKGRTAPRIGREDLQDPDRDAREPREGSIEPDGERSDRDAGAGRPVQLDERGDGERGGRGVPPAK